MDRRAFLKKAAGTATAGAAMTVVSYPGKPLLKSPNREYDFSLDKCEDEIYSCRV